MHGTAFHNVTYGTYRSLNDFLYKGYSHRVGEEVLLDEIHLCHASVRLLMECDMI